ncbi:MAG: tetratricopeptide repeat protein [Bacteroidota bacterium]
MKKNILYRFNVDKNSKKLIGVTLIALFGCSPYKNNPLSGSFHDLTAHYNAYFIANERIKEIENSIHESQDWNYNKVLPIFPQFDSTKSASLKTEIEDCIQKASISIQRHPGSKWEDDSYILVGKARHYAGEFTDAIETYKYVNTHSKNNNSRHYALTELIRSFTEFEEYYNAIAVTDHLAREKLNKDNQRRLYLNSAYLYQKKNDQDKMVSNLVKAEELYNSSDKARINFIIGQLYHQLDFESEAFRYYRRVLKNNPTYELEFYAKLYMAQVTELAETNDLKRIRKYFRNLLKDPKNKEYQDKIYYELAGFELKNGNLEEAIENYELSIRASTNNNRQKGYSYLSLGKIYYDSIKNFVLAKSYYDSTVNTLPRDEDNYEKIENRQKILVDFVEQIVTIHQNDSLLSLAKLPEDSLLSLASSVVEKVREENKKKQEKTRQAAINRKKNIADQNGSNLISTERAGSLWYFNNVSQIAKGSNDFIQKWGNRPLEDNWRRINKSSITISDDKMIETENISEASGEVVKKTLEEEALVLLEVIPKTKEEKQQLLNEIEIALYKLGNIYNLRLEEDENAIESFETLLQRFPATDYKPEVLYQLYLLFKPKHPDKARDYGEMLKKDFPETIYAKLVDNPNYREESFATTAQLKTLYKRLYQYYENESYKEVIYSVDSALRIHDDNEFSDNLALLRVLAVGQLEEERKYQYELNEFIKKYENSDVLNYANSLAQASENFQQKRYNSGRARFIEYFNQKHFFVVIYDTKGSLTLDVPKVVDGYLKEKKLINLKTGNLVLSESKSMVFVDAFPGKSTAKSFYNSFKEKVDLKGQFKGEKFEVFIITEDNFDVFYKTKDISSYLNFFEKYYQ